MRFTPALVVTCCLLFLPSLSFSQSCVDVYKSNERTALLPLSGPHLELQAGEIAKTGIVLKATGPKGNVSEVLNRDGTYPLIVNRAGDVVISHRLPEIDVNPETTAFLATHRGLYSKLQSEGLNSEIIYAGEMRVIGGRVSSLIDQAGTFHNRLSDLGPQAEMADLAKSNSARIDFAVSILTSMGLVESSTSVKNFVKNFGMYGGLEGRKDGHANSRDVALYEIKCMAIPACFASYQKLQSFIAKIVEKGGEDYLVNMSQSMKMDLFMNWGQAMQLTGAMVREGVLDILSLSQNDIVSTSAHSYRSKPVKHMVENLDTLYSLFGLESN